MFHVPNFETWFLRSPQGQEMLHAMEAERHAERDSLLAELAELRAAWGKRGERLATAKAALFKKLIAARAALEAANKEHLRNAYQAIGESNQFHNRENAILNALAELTPVEVDEAATRIDAEIESLMQGKPMDFDAARARLATLRAKRSAVSELVTAKNPARELADILSGAN